MRTIRRSAVAATLALIVSTATMTTASPATRVLDGYCSPSGDYCTAVLRKDDGTIVFTIRAFANYFGRAEACVTKETRICRSRSPREHDGLFDWTIRWQGNYPREGTGRYTVRWLDESGGRLGPALHFRRG